LATLTTQTITRAGVDPSLTAAAGGGDSFTPGDDVFLHINNGGGSSCNSRKHTKTAEEFLSVAA